MPTTLSTSEKPLSNGKIDSLPSKFLSDRQLLLNIRNLSKVSEVQGLWGVIRQWIIIVGTAALSIYIAPKMGALGWALYFLSVLVIATRQHCLLALMHEGTHSRLSRNRAWNEFISDMFCAFPMGISTDLYRRAHLQHHAHTNTNDDPYWVGMQSHEDWHWPKDHIDAMKLFALDLVGLAGHKLILLFFNWSPARAVIERHLKLSHGERLRLIAFLMSLTLILSVFHLWRDFVLYWVVPALTLLTPMVRMRSVAEHLVLESEHELNKTRHVESNFIERQLVAPMNLNYHVAHHLFPSIPFYNLPKVHALLMSFEDFRHNAHFTPSYWGMKKGVWAEITERASR